MTRTGRHGAVKAALFGAAAGAAGTAAMDVIEFARYRRGGGTEKLLGWETADGVETWDNASGPGQFGKRLAERLSGREMPDHWARSTTNLVHCATGLGWGAQFGLLNGSSRRHQWELALLLGPTVWLAGYVILPLAKVYKPIWEYDGATLAKDLSVHMAYGAVTAATFGALTRSMSRP
jgi:hypothetical protein